MPRRDVADVIHAAEACPGECIFIEIDMPIDTVDIRRPEAHPTTSMPPTAARLNDVRPDRPIQLLLWR